MGRENKLNYMRTVVWSLGIIISSTVFMSRNFEIVKCIKHLWAILLYNWVINERMSHMRV